MATTVRDIGFRLGYDLDKQTEAKVEDSIKGLKNMATKLLGAIGIGFSLIQINSIVEEFRTVNRAIKSSVDGLEDLEVAEKSILEAANDSRTTYESMATTVSNLVKSGSNLFPVQDAVDFSSAVTKMLKVAGRGDETVNSLMDAFNKSFQKGTVGADTLNVMMEKCPEAADLLADSLGVARTKLLDMATNGQISCQQLKDAFLNSADEIDASFGSMDLSITEAIQSVRNSWGFMLADFDEVFGVTNTIARTITKISNTALSAIDKIKTRLQWLADKLGGANKLLKLIAISAGAIFVALNAGKIQNFFKSLGSMLKASNLKIMAIVAAIVLLALLVEDFFAFMKGENSFIGEMLEKAGVDTDAFRQTCKELWAQVKDILPVVKQFAKTISGQLFDAVKRILPLLGRLVASVLPTIVELIQKILPLAMQIAQSVLPIILQLIGQLLPFFLQIIEQILPLIISLVEMLLPMVMQIIETVLPIIISLFDQLLPLVMQIIETVLPVILELISSILPILGQIIETILPVVLELITAILPILEPIIALVANLISTLLPPLVTLLQAILPILQPVLEILKPIADILGVIIGAISKVVGWVADGLSWIVDLIFGGGGDNDDSASKVNDYDSNGDNGSSNTPKVNAYAKGTDNSSETFIAGEEGPELITGAAGKKVFTALETGKIFQAMAMLGKAATVQPSTVTNTTSSSSRVVNQYNEFVNTFNGDRAGQKKSAEAMGTASNDAVAVMARALSFAR